MSGAQLEAALAYAAHGWPVFPQDPKTRRGLIRGFPAAATTDQSTIETWFRRWRDAAISVVTGVRSGIVVLDIDTKPGGPNGFDTLETEFAVSTHPETPTDHTPHSGA